MNLTGFPGSKDCLGMIGGGGGPKLSLFLLFPKDCWYKVDGVVLGLNISLQFPQDCWDNGVGYS